MSEQSVEVHKTYNLEEEKKEILKQYRKLLSACRPTISKEDRKFIRKAFNFALQAHEHHRRQTGEPYIYHPIAVANIVIKEVGLDTTSVVCSLLHDVAEDTDYTLADIEAYFGSEVAKIIDGLTKISDIFDHTDSIQAENFRKMLLTLSDDVRVILIKIADRLHNMRTLDALPPKKQLKVANETLYLFAPLAHRLGFHAIKSELEDLGLKYTDPEIFFTISQKLEETAEERKKFIQKFTAPIKKVLKEEEYDFEVVSRTKSISSIWSKMQNKEVPFEEVYDIFAIRIILNSPIVREKSDCWRVYSLITDIYRPNPDRLRDWLSTPKANGYESLHTTVMGHDGKWVEVQIRSGRMNEIAEKGYAAHWKYKDAKGEESGIDKWLNRISDLLKSSEADALDFIDDFKLNLFSDEIFVFTPKGDLKTLPIGATALDFAYSIHTQVGNNCLGAKVNHKLVPLNYKLKSGDQVEIITSTKQKPKTDWVNYVTTARAKGKIKNALKEQRKTLAGEGKEILARKFKQLKIDNTQNNVNQLVKYLQMHSHLDLYSEVAKGNITNKDLKSFLGELDGSGGFLSYLKKPFAKSKETDSAVIDQKKDVVREKLQNQPDTLLIGDAMENLNYTLSPCCKPIPGDDVFGFVAINEGIKIHRNNCPNAVQLLSKYAYRVVKAKWITKHSIAFLSGLYVKGIDDVGMVNKITNLISEEQNLNMRSIHIESNAGTFEGTVMLYIKDTKHLKTLIKKLKRINGVKSVTRINKD